MKLHSDYLTLDDVARAFSKTRESGFITIDVFLAQIARDGSKSHRYAYLVQLGTFDRDSLPSGKKRYRKNSGISGADKQLWAATYDEWGWFISALFALDPDAKFGNYQNAEDFHKQTKHKFELNDDDDEEE